MLKTCTSCSKELPVSEFGVDRHRKDGLSRRCRPCGREYEAQRRAANPEAHREKVARWAEKNPEKRREYVVRTRPARREWEALYRAENREKLAAATRRWRERNVERRAAYDAKYQADNADAVSLRKKRWNERNPDRVASYGTKRRSNPKYKLEAAIRSRVHDTLKRGLKTGKTFDLLGYSVEDLHVHLERQFSRGMTWENYGEWHVDHILPLSSFSYTSPDDDEFRRAWALPNLRPLWADTNVRKGAKRLTLL